MTREILSVGEQKYGRADDLRTHAAIWASDIVQEYVDRADDKGVDFSAGMDVGIAVACGVTGLDEDTVRGAHYLHWC
jgi:ABC-type phosphonate transport system ATPase subunit